jgi:hypothetical protein
MLINATRLKRCVN